MSPPGRAWGRAALRAALHLSCSLALSLVLVWACRVAPASAQRPVDLALVLAVDVSRSIDADEAKLQREGYIAALTNPRVIQAIASGPLGAIAIAYVEWAGSDYQRTVVPWTVVRGTADA